MTEVINGVTFDIGEKEQSVCARFLVCPVTIHFGERRLTYVMDAVYLDLPEARHNQFAKIVTMLEQAKERES